MSLAKWWPFCLSLNMSSINWYTTMCLYEANVVIYFWIIMSPCERNCWRSYVTRALPTDTIYGVVASLLADLTIAGHFSRHPRNSCFCDTTAHCFSYRLESLATGILYIFTFRIHLSKSEATLVDYLSRYVLFVSFESHAFETLWYISQNNEQG